MAAQGAAAADVPHDSSMHVRKLQVGDIYQSKQEITTVVRLALLASGHDCVCESGGGRQGSWRCTGRVFKQNQDVGCRFRIKATKQTRGEASKWKLTGVHNEHVNCSMAKAARGPGVVVLQNAGASIVSANPDISVPSFSKLMQEKVGVKVHERTLGRVKRRALDERALADAKDFQFLDSYAKKVEADCGGSVTDVRWDSDGHFDRCFFMLGQSAHVAAKSPQEVFCLDRCNLKGDWNGVACLLTVKDANNRLVIVAMAVAVGEFEMADLYEYVLVNAAKNPEMAAFLDKETTTYFVDGDGAGVPLVVPKAEGRRCLRHLLSTITPPVDKDCSDHIFGASRAPSENVFNYFMDTVKVLKPAAHAIMMAHPLGLWANYKCRRNRTWDQVTTNTPESALIVKHLLALPVLELAKGMVELMATKLHDASQLQQQTLQDLQTPFAEKTYEAEYQSSRTFTVRASCIGVYTVSLEGKAKLENRVHLTWATKDLEAVMRCTCGFPERWNLPCRHLLAVCSASHTLHRASTLMGKDFSLDAYRTLAYSPALAVNTPIWNQLTKDPTRKAPKSAARVSQRKKGRPKKKRTPLPGELSASSHNETPTASTAGSSTEGGRGSGACGAQALPSQGAVDLRRVKPVTVDFHRVKTPRPAVEFPAPAPSVHLGVPPAVSFCGAGRVVTMDTDLRQG